MAGAAVFLVSVLGADFLVPDANRSESSSSLLDCVKISVVDADVVAPLISTFGFSGVNFGGPASYEFC